MGWKPRADEIAFLVRIVNSLKIGGLWGAPMGFTFKKTGPKRLELYSVEALSAQGLEKVVKALEMTEIAGKAAGIEVVTKSTAAYAMIVFGLEPTDGGPT